MLFILNMATAHIPTVAVLVIDAAEEIACTGGSQVDDGLLHRHFDVFLGDLVGCGVILDGSEQLGDHAVTMMTR